MSISTDSRPRQGEGLDFVTVYRANVAAVRGFFARRGADPQTVADLTSETFAEAIGALHTFDPAKGPPRPWLYAIARAVYARHREQSAQRGDGRPARASRRARRGRHRGADAGAGRGVAGVAAGALRVRRFRARTKLRKEMR